MSEPGAWASPPLSAVPAAPARLWAGFVCLPAGTPSPAHRSPWAHGIHTAGLQVGSQPGVPCTCVLVFLCVSLVWTPPGATGTLWTWAGQGYACTCTAGDDRVLSQDR